MSQELFYDFMRNHRFNSLINFMEWNNYCNHFIDAEVGAHREKAVFPKSHSYEAAQMGLTPRWAGS